MAVFSAISSIVGAKSQAKAVNNAAEMSSEAQERMNTENNAVQREMNAANIAATEKQLATTRADQFNFYNQGRDDNAEYLEYGQRALNTVGNLNGLNGQDAANRALSDFTASPGYQYQVDQSLKAADATAAARGGALSGNAIAGATAIGSGLAAQEYGNYYNRLAGVASAGQNAASLMSGQGQATANALTQAGTSANSAIVGANSAAAAGISASNSSAANALSDTAISQGKSLSSIYGQQTASLNQSITGGLSDLAGAAGYFKGGGSSLLSMLPGKNGGPKLP